MPPSPAAALPVVEGHVIVQLRYRRPSELFIVSVASNFDLVFDSFCALFSVDPAGIGLLFGEGSAVRPDDTPESLGLVNNDVLWLDDVAR